ncbi:hypothetical protein E2C01_041125 [Portunus trituberculatus]|uniref:Uncharacterized protein n=1 Tax=Portunus trituberculatus TaxID=210409 RepID=A0A5B7FJ69_PORTR|nr:hypothetical protein [Portunus trituberculatus]
MPQNTTDSGTSAAVSHARLCASGGMSRNPSNAMDAKGIIIFATQHSQRFRHPALASPSATAPRYECRS